MSKILKLVLCLVFASAFVAASVVAVAPGAARVFDAGHSTPEALFLNPLDERSLVFDAAGGLRATLYGEQNRAPVPLSAIPEQVINAVLDVEDQNFWSHEGVNLRSTVRALFENVAAGGVAQGGSTITMQVVKSVMGDETSLERKSREAILALRLEEQLTKEQILERYLNTVYFGNGAYGVQAAAETYWNVGVAELDWGQAALLASIIRYPDLYNPIRHPEVASERRRIALGLIVDAGHITEEQAGLYAYEPLPTQVSRIAPSADDYFLEEVKQILLDDPSYGIGSTPEERYQAVFSGGLRIHTTFDPNMQALALQARNDVLPGELDGQFLFRNRVGEDVQGTAVVVTTDVHTGAVRALVGGPGFDAYRYNIATQGIGRQAGSSFKTFVLAAALESGLVPNDTVAGSGPCRFPNPGGYPDPYIVQNFGNSGGGGGSITQQTLRSSNCAYVRLGQIVGLQRVVDVAQRMGITTPLTAGILSMPLGAFEVLPVDMAAAYGSIANDGIYNEPYYIERIEGSDGTVLYQHQPNGRRALTRQTARLAAQVLEANVTGGTGTRARLTSQPAGGKTGTAQDSADAWFVGFTPQYATAVWMGATAGRVPMGNVGGVSVTGGSYPARIWGQYMNAVLDGIERVEFADPESTRGGRSLRLPSEVDPGGSGSSSSGRGRGSGSGSGSGS
ncbi:MAG: transglycosylase domain-containing protein, partial [Acidimicrobiia bacterium]|nr:transglycosylase domain-containing protein [Acidimicrobiia bacterium]